MGDYNYVKVILYAYPKLDMLAEAVSSGAEIKARLSFRTENTFACAEEIANRILEGRKLRELRVLMDEILSVLGEEELYLLEYKYFRRKSVLVGRFGETKFGGSEREYYRTQNELLKKVAFLLLVRGMTEERYFEEYAKIRPFPRVLRAVREGRERKIVSKRQASGVRFTQNSDSRTGAFLPRSTKKAIAETAAAVRQISTICKAEGAEDEAVSSGSFVSCDVTGASDTR